MGNQVSSNSLRLDRMAGLFQLSYSGAWGATLKVSGLVEVNGAFYEFTEETPAGSGNGVAVVPAGTTAALVYVDPDDYSSAPIKNGYYDTTGANRQIYQTDTQAGIIELYNSKSKVLSLAISGNIKASNFYGGVFIGAMSGRQITNGISGEGQTEATFWNKIIEAFPDPNLITIPCSGVYAMPDGGGYRARSVHGVYINRAGNSGAIGYSTYADNSVILAIPPYISYRTFSSGSANLLGVDIII
jgi:hypothetical protein